MSEIHTDPASGRRYEVGPDGQSRWIDPPPPQPPGPQPFATQPTAQQPYAQQAYGQPQYAPTQQYGQPAFGQPAPKKKHTARNVILGVVGVLVLLGGCGAIINSVGSKSTETTASGTAAGGSVTGKASAAPPAKPAAKAPGIGSPVRDGKFEFTVTKVTGAQRVGNDLLNKTAQGAFVLVHVTVKNIGDKAQLFDGSSQKFKDADGKEYSSDGAAAIYLQAESKSFLEQINPGNSVTGIVVFDVPKGTKLTTLELHDSMFSGGIEVSVPVTAK